MEIHIWMVEVFPDSRYAENCMPGWIYKWSGNGWMNARGEPVVNQDLIEKVLK
jgi:ribonuclease HI